MYSVKCKKKFSMPLEVDSFASRYEELLKNDGRKKVLYIKNEFDNSTFRYRCYNFKQALELSDKYLIVYFLSDEIKKIINEIDNVSLVVLQRATFNIDILNFINYVHQKKIHVVYDMDDMLYNIENAINYINHIGREYDLTNVYLYFGIASAYGVLAEKCDYYITTTEFLKKNLENDYGKKGFVIPNFLNNEQIIESEYILKNREFNNDKFIIGYFSGSDSHRNDFRVIENAILQLMNEYDDIYLKIVGFMQLDKRFDEFKKKGRVIMKDLVPYQKLQYEIGEVDLNVVPLADVEFNKAKSELKYFEAAIVKVPSCVSKGNIYDSFIDDFQNGVLCDIDNWKNCIEKLYLDRDLLKKIASNAYDTANKLYLPSIYKEKIESVYDEILKDTI